MVKIELSDGEEVVDKVVTKFGRIEGMKKWSGKRVKVIVLGEKSDE